MFIFAMSLLFAAKMLFYFIWVRMEVIEMKSLKKCLVSLFALVFVSTGVSFTSSADSVLIDDINYEFNMTDEGVVLYRVTSDRDVTELELPEQLDGHSITKIMGYRNESGLHGTFQGLTNLEKIVIHDGITTIGTHAFRNCTKLSSVTLPESVQAIDMCAFMRCASLQSVYLPKSVERVRYNAFAGCTSLREIYAAANTMFDAGALDANLQVTQY